jgi:hypothetical protein
MHRAAFYAISFEERLLVAIVLCEFISTPCRPGSAVESVCLQFFFFSKPAAAFEKHFQI